MYFKINSRILFKVFVFDFPNFFINLTVQYNMFFLITIVNEVIVFYKVLIIFLLTTIKFLIIYILASDKVASLILCFIF